MAIRTSEFEFSSDYLLVWTVSMINTGKNLFIVAAKRTAFGKFGGALKDKTATDLAEHACRAALQECNIPADQLDHIVIGNVIQSSSDAHYLARHVGLRIGLPVDRPAVSVNRLCGSGFQSIIDACHQILCGDSKAVIAGGTENMSQCPFVVRNIRFGTNFATTYAFEDSLWSGLTDPYCDLPMAMTAEKLGHQYQLKREDVDQFACQSQNRWANAQQSGKFTNEIVPIQIKTSKGEKTFDTDENPRPTELSALRALKPVFKKNGLVTTGNASGICDGAAAVVVVDEQTVGRYNLNPMARIVQWSVVGCEPSIMGIGPVPAIRNILASSKLKLNQIDLIEAFAAQTVSVNRELALDQDKLNVNGGAIAIGHPLGASGTRIIGHICHEMRRREVKYAIGSACIGGGQGIAMLLQKV